MWGEEALAIYARYGELSARKVISYRHQKRSSRASSNNQHTRRLTES